MLSAGLSGSPFGNGKWDLNSLETQGRIPRFEPSTFTIHRSGSLGWQVESCMSHGFTGTISHPILDICSTEPCHDDSCLSESAPMIMLARWQSQQWVSTTGRRWRQPSEKVRTTESQLSRHLCEAIAASNTTRGCSRVHPAWGLHTCSVLCTMRWEKK